MWRLDSRIAPPLRRESTSKTPASIQNLSGSVGLLMNSFASQPVSVVASASAKAL
jgi:hypothetical protein